MKLIIDIPSGVYDNLQKIKVGSIANHNILNSVKNGTPLESQPIRKKGKWIEVDGEAQCSNCNRFFPIGAIDTWVSCPRCGADMREVRRRMTNEEAIKIINNYEINGCGYCHQGGEEVKEAFEMAIKALETQPMEG